MYDMIYVLYYYMYIYTYICIFYILYVIYICIYLHILYMYIDEDVTGQLDLQRVGVRQDAWPLPGQGVRGGNKNQP